MTGIGLYPEKEEPRLGKLDQLAASVGGIFAPWLRPSAKRFSRIVQVVHACGKELEALSDGEILERSKALRPLLRSQGFRIDLVGKSFALVKEVARRTLGMPHFDVQLIGGWVILNGMVAEMETGEGKTLAATLPACTAALAGVPVHIITVNDYLAQRDTEWMAPIYRSLGITVGTVVHGMDPAAKRRAYRCDVTYCTNKELAFDYLRDRIVLWDRPSPLRLQLEKLYGEGSRVNQLLMRGLHFGIVDEADSVLIDEARTPLIISSGGEGVHDPRIYVCAMNLARELVEKQDSL
ncbi:MAG: prepilin peptidase, partial [Deltaproteobacteria bacterium]|nr:prepilin peptidase [Deltaproteobacteria bacterium]